MNVKIPSRGWSLFLFSAIVSLPPRPLSAEDRSPLFLAIQAGVGSVFSPSDVSDTHTDPLLFGGRLGYRVSNRWSFGGQLSTYGIGSNGTPSQDLRLTPLTAWAQREFPWTRLWTPFVLGEFGLSRNKTENHSLTDSNTGWTAGVSLGLTLKISDMQDLSFEVGARQFARATFQREDLRLLNGAISLRFFLPESWVPRKTRVDISEADLEIPLLSSESAEEVDPVTLLQNEVTFLQKEIDEKRVPPITFDSGSAILQTTSFQALDALGAIFRRYPDVRVRIYGYVEEGESRENKAALALARSQVVGTYVVQNFYLNEARFLCLGERPVFPPTPVSRRIELEAIPNR